jgi:hypothetical protein
MGVDWVWKPAAECYGIGSSLKVRFVMASLSNVQLKIARTS